MIVQNQTHVQSKNYSEVKKENSVSNGKFNLQNGKIVTINNQDNIKATLGYVAKEVNLDRFKNSSNVVSTVPLGTKVGVVSTIGNWSEVIYNGYRGYVPSADIINTGNKIDINSKTNKIIGIRDNQAGAFNLDLYNGWKNVNGSWYYYKNGEKSTGWIVVNGYCYYMNQNGAMCTGWKQINGIWYYMNNNGEMAIGWCKVNQYWYYMNNGGDMSVGWIQVKGTWYYLNQNGQMQVGWQKIDGQTYYLQSSGAMVTGKVDIDGNTYMFNQSGQLETATSLNVKTISGNAIANTSAYISSLPQAGANHLANLHNGDILKLTGETNDWYKVDFDGIVGYIEKQYTIKLSPGTVTLQNTSDDNNVWETDGLTNAQLTETNVNIEAKAAEVCEGLTTDYQKAKAIYDWVSTNIIYNYQDAYTTTEALMKGSEAIEVFNTKTGVCQGYADLYAAMCRAEGIHVKVVESNTHAWNEVYTPATGWFKVDCTWASSAYANPNVIANANGSYTNKGNGYGYSISNLQPINDPNYTSKYVYTINQDETVTFSGDNDYFDNPNNPEWQNPDHQYEYTSSEGFMVIPNK